MCLLCKRAYYGPGWFERCERRFMRSVGRTTVARFLSKRTVHLIFSDLPLTTTPAEGLIPKRLGLKRPGCLLAAGLLDLRRIARDRDADPHRTGAGDPQSALGARAGQRPRCRRAPRGEQGPRVQHRADAAADHG